MLMNKRQREQEGNMHVYFRANGRYTVFYDDEDNKEMLRRMDKFAKHYESKIMEFTLMGNHAHFLVNTPCVTELMRETLKSYSRWYNRKYKNSNKVFATPFSSACKRSDDWVLMSSIYILQNPVVAGMCARAEDYKWSSALMHFKDAKKSIPIGYDHYLQLCSCIDVDTSFVDSLFGSYEEFLDYVNRSSVPCSAVISKQSKWETWPMERLSGEVDRLLGGRVLNNLSRTEIKELIVALDRQTNCKMRHISSLLHVDYSFVKRCLRKVRFSSPEAPQPE